MSAQQTVLVVGGGVTGATTAALLAQAGWSVAVVDQKPPKAYTPDPSHRVVALGLGAQRIFKHLGVWPRLGEGAIAPYPTMHVEAKGQALTFQADAHGLPELGFMVEIPWLEAVLTAHIEDHPNIEVHAPALWSEFSVTDSGVRLYLGESSQAVTDTLTGALLVGADGARSAVRQRAGIDTTHIDYNQSALIGPVATTHPNPGIAWQRFTPLGPLALLPLPTHDGRSSIVWSIPRTDAHHHQALDPSALVEAINTGLGEPLPEPMGAIESIDHPQWWPLKRQRAQRMHQGRVVLVGDAAHSVHPLAGQGLNLGLLDAAALAECLNPLIDPGARGDWDRALNRFGRWRLSNTTVAGEGIHLINALQHAPLGLGQTALAGAFFAANALWPVRQALIERATGIDADAPTICRTP